METGTSLAVLVTVAFSLLGVVGDYFLKLASEEPNALATRSFYVGFVVYASTAFGWVFVMKHLKLATVGVVYSISMVLLLAAVGVVGFKESLNGYEIAGLVMAVADHHRGRGIPRVVEPRGGRRPRDGHRGADPPHAVRLAVRAAPRPLPSCRSSGATSRSSGTSRRW